MLAGSFRGKGVGGQTVDVTDAMGSPRWSAARSDFVTGVAPNLAARTVRTRPDQVGASTSMRESGSSRPDRTASDEPTLIRSQQVSGSSLARRLQIQTTSLRGFS